MEPLYVKVKSTAPYYKNRKMRYVGETIYPNGRHAIEVINNRINPTWGGAPVEIDINDVEFLFEDKLRTICHYNR